MWFRRNAALVVNLVCLSLVMYVGWQVHDLRSHNLVVLEEYFMQTLSSTWRSGGTSHTLTTPKLEGESNGDWVARHQAALTAAQEAFPVDP